MAGCKGAACSAVPCSPVPGLAGWLAGWLVLLAWALFQLWRWLRAEQGWLPYPFPQSTHATSCPAEHPTTAPASAPEMQPGTPVGSASSSRGQRGDGSSSEEGAPGNVVQHDEVLPLLAGESGSGRLAPGLRRRQGHQECG